MRSAFAKRVAWAGLLALTAPLACSSSSPSGGADGAAGAGTPAAGAGPVASAGATASAGAVNAAGGSSGQSSGSAGSSAGQASSGAPGVGGSSGGAAAGAPGAGGSPVAGAGAGGMSTAGAGGGSATLNDGSNCDYTDDKQFCACMNASCGGDTYADKSKMLRSVYCGVCSAGKTCVGTATDAGGALGVCQALTGLTDVQKAKAAALTSIWENSTPVLAYGYSEDIGDNRGYTSGRAGFCTGTGDGIVVVQCFNAAKPGNALSKYLPELVRLEKLFVSSKGMLQGDISGLVGYNTAWMSLGADPGFMACQDSVVDAVYYGPALRKANAKKLKAALTIVSLWDAQIMHGEQDPSFGTVALMAQADKLVTLSDPPTDAEESAWLGAFHKVRAQVMAMHAEWKGNAYRVATYEQLRLAGNMAFTGCVKTGAVSSAQYWPGTSSAKSDVFNVCDK